MGISLLFAVFYIFISLSSHPSTATDTLTPTQNLTDGFTLVSSNQRFELGFFSTGPSNSTSSRYLGIWYHNLPLTVVWVANKHNPITDLFGTLILNNNGLLLLYNRSMGIVWSTNRTLTVNRPILQLLDSGNLVVRDVEISGTNYYWESFDFMSDTLLPGMKLGWNLNTRLNRFMTSWKNSDDPSDGEFTFSLDPPESPQLVLRRGSQKQYRWGPFDGNNKLRPNPVFQSMFIYNSEEVYYRYEVLDESVLTRLVVNQLGSVQYLTWRNDTREWSMMITLNRDYCDRYGMCGAYGNCYTADPNCRCLKGFTPNSPRDWSLFGWSDGCKHRYELNCTNGDGFLKYTGLKLPDFSVVWPSYSNEECRAECLKACDCMAYTNIDVHGNGSQCVVWLDQLIDIRSSPNGEKGLYIRMARAELESIAHAKRKKRVVKISVIVIATVFGILLSCGVCWYICQKRRARRKGKRFRKKNFNLDDTTDTIRGTSQEDVGSCELPLFDFDKIVGATNNFSKTNKLGEGGFGPVYKGMLEDGQEVAVKRLSSRSGQGIEEFKNEIILISKLQHRNLVRLLGCCIDGDEKLLIYEYMTNKSLDTFLFDPKKRVQLDWAKRFNIIQGVARGLLYLHRDSCLRVIHRDLKGSNILLDDQMNPKISDFGLARTFRMTQELANTHRIVGTFGYMSPEYAMRGIFSEKSDVFSFGVVLLEIVSSARNTGFYNDEQYISLLDHAWQLWKGGRELALIDQALTESCFLAQVQRCLHIGLLCVQDYAADRPTMSAVVLMLSNETDLPQPKQPTFTFQRVFDSNSKSKCPGVWSPNEVTFSLTHGR